MSKITQRNKLTEPKKWVVKVMYKDQVYYMHHYIHPYSGGHSVSLTNTKDDAYRGGKKELQQLLVRLFKNQDIFSATILGDDISNCEIVLA